MYNSFMIFHKYFSFYIIFSNSTFAWGQQETAEISVVGIWQAITHSSTANNNSSISESIEGVRTFLGACGFFRIYGALVAR